MMHINTIIYPDSLKTEYFKNWYFITPLAVATNLLLFQKIHESLSSLTLKSNSLDYTTDIFNVTDMLLDIFF